MIIPQVHLRKTYYIFYTCPSGHSTLWFNSILWPQRVAFGLSEHARSQQPDYLTHCLLIPHSGMCCDNRQMVRFFFFPFFVAYIYIWSAYICNITFHRNSIKSLFNAVYLRQVSPSVRPAIGELGFPPLLLLTLRCLLIIRVELFKTPVCTFWASSFTVLSSHMPVPRIAFFIPKTIW